MASYYLTRIRLNTQRRNTRRLILSRERIHAALNRCFPESEEVRIIWRLDVTSTTPVIYMVSDSMPDCEGIVEQYCWRNLPYADSVQTAPYDNFVNSIKNGQRFRFRCGFNPSIRSHRTAKVHPVTDAETQELLIKKTNGCFRIEKCQDSSEGVSFTKGTGKHRHTVNFKYSVVEGYMTVLDAEKFKTYLINGIGREKAYGCGLMSVIPLD